MRAWIFQDTKQRAKRGEKACPWSVGWYDHAGRKKSKTIGPKSTAEKYRKKIEAQLALGFVDGPQRAKWADFRERHKNAVLATKPLSTVELFESAMDNFERIANPVYVDTITTETVDLYAAKRSREPRRGRVATKDRPAAPPVSPATVNRELRHLRAVLRKANRWGLLDRAPEVTFLREAETDPFFIDDDTFAKLYAACDKMTRPDDGNSTPSDWWRALLTFAYLTGWRIGEILDLRRADLDLETGIATVDAENTKGRRTARVELHPVAIEHLRGILGFSPFVFEWQFSRRALHSAFTKLKAEADVKFPGAFHRLRFGFANANVDHVDADLLQRLMRHRSPQTTRHYINAAERMKRSGVATKLHVPASLLAASG